MKLKINGTSDKEDKIQRSKLRSVKKMAEIRTVGELERVGQVIKACHQRS